MSKLLLVLLVFPLCLISQEKFEFINEKIDFSLSASLFSINGIYVFVNNAEKNVHQTIFFPFSENSESLNINRIYNLTYNENLTFKQVTNGLIFKMFMFPKDTVSINISYNQNTKRENTYILESTQTWGKPLHNADYSLSADNSVRIDSISLKPDTLINNVYYWHKQNFYPNENFRVWIK